MACDRCAPLEGRPSHIPPPANLEYVKTVTAWTGSRERYRCACGAWWQRLVTQSVAGTPMSTFGDDSPVWERVS
jgi:hypothetical protein